MGFVDIRQMISNFLCRRYRTLESKRERKQLCRLHRNVHTSYKVITALSQKEQNHRCMQLYIHTFMHTYTYITNIPQMWKESNLSICTVILLSNRPHTIIIGSIHIYLLPIPFTFRSNERLRLKRTTTSGKLAPSVLTHIGAVKENSAFECRILISTVHILCPME